MIRGYAYFGPSDQRVFATQLFGAFGIGSGRYYDESVALLIELTADPDPAVVAQAVRSLGVRGDVRSIEWLVDRQNPDGTFRTLNPLETPDAARHVVLVASWALLEFLGS